ncbi:MAG: potassium-transporting ATPase subunit F [Planctomycetaceae bacterium]|nr:potassium-transporting ATPase subunit F [Planctomycetaceae bacterium]
MDWTTILAFVVAVVLVIYLSAALVVPEKFS